MSLHLNLNLKLRAASVELLLDYSSSSVLLSLLSVIKVESNMNGAAGAGGETLAPSLIRYRGKKFISA